MSGKELSSMKTTVGVTPRSKSRRRRREPDSASASDKENLEADSNAAVDKSSKRRNEVLAVVRAAAAATSQADFWMKHSNLLDVIVDASFLQNTASAASLLLQEKTVDVSNVCRKLVKEAKEAKSCRAKLDCLCVAVHGLRALSRSLAAGSKQDAAVKLLYHAVVTAEQIMGDTTIGVDNEERQRAASYSLAAYQALGELLRRYSVSTKGAVKTVVFSNDKAGEDAFCSIFPVPEKGSGKQEVSGSLELNLVCSIGIQSTIAASRVLSRLWGRPDKTTNLVSEFDGLVRLLFRERSFLMSGMLYLIRNISATWISFLAFHSEGDCAKDIMSHCKQVHRILWDATSSIGDSKEDAEKCLLLRKNSISALLLGEDGSKLPTRIRSALNEKHLKSACSYAWKAAVSYTQIVGTSASGECSQALRQFHNEIGSLFEAFGVQDSLVWAEYWAYRTMHIGATSSCPCSSEHCMFASLPFKYVHEKGACESGNSASYAFLATLFLTLHVRDLLERIDELTESDITADFIKSAKTISSRLRSNVIESNQTLAVANLTRYFKLLSMISLHHTVFRLLERDDVPLVGPASTLLALSADILVDCIGPLGRTVAAAGKSMDESKSKLAWELPVECFLQGISVLEILKSPVSWERANSSIIELANTIDRKRSRLKAPPSCIKKVAKFLTNTGRRRFENNEGADARIPLLISIQLLTNMARDSSVQPHNATVQLSARWSYLAMVYKSQEMVDEAAIASVSSLVCDASETSVVRSDSRGDAKIDLLNYLASLTKDVIVTSPTPDMCLSDSRKRAVSRLVSMLSDRAPSNLDQKDSAKPSGFSLPMAVDAMLGATQDATAVTSVFEEKSQMPFSLGSIFHAMFAKSVVPFAQVVDERVVLCEKIKILADSINALGLILQRKSLDPADVDATIATLEYLLRLSGSYARKVADPDEGDSFHVIVGTLYVVASVSILSSQPGIDFENWTFRGMNDIAGSGGDGRFEILLKLARDFVGRSSNSFTRVPTITGDNWGSLLCALRPAVSLYHLHLSCATHEKTIRSHKNIISHARTAVDIVRDEEFSGSEFVTMSKACVTFALSRLCGWLSSEGEMIQAAQVASWNMETGGDDSTETRLWSEAVVFSLSSTATDHPDKNLPCIIPVNATDTELFAWRLRSLLKSASYKEVASYRDQLISLTTKVDTMISHSSTREVTKALQWSRTTVILGLADAAERFAEVYLAISLLRRCHEATRKIAESLMKERKPPSSTLQSDVPFWNRIVMATLLIRCTERQICCLRRIGKLYSRVGDHRRADTYAVSLADVTGTKIADGTGRKVSFSENVSYSRLHPCESSREMQIRRSLLCTQGRATALDTLLENLGGGNDYASLSAAEFAKWRDELSVNQELEKINNILTVGDMLSGGVPAVVGDRLQTVYAFAKKRLDAFVQEPRFLSLGAPRETSVLKGFDRSIPDVYFNLRLAEARALLSLDDRSNLERASKIRACCAEIIESSLSPVSCRVWAFYLLGLLELDSARRTGELAALWQDTDQEAAVIGTDVEKARGLFKCCLPFLGPASELLNRNVLRCLALATGPEQTEKIIQMSACALIHTSIGSTARQHVSMHLSGDEGRDDEDLVSDSTPGARDINQIEEVFKILDYPVDATDHASSVDMLFEEIGKRVPSDWRFVAIALCPSGELLLNSLEKSESGDSLVSRTVCIFPDSTADARRPVHIYDDIMKPLDNIIQRSQDQLEGVNLEQADIVSNDVSQKREWWNNRESLDIELRNLIERVEHSIFGSERARLVLLGSSGSFEDDAFEAEGASNLMCGNLASKFEAATFSDSSVRQFGEIEPSDMKVAELRDELVERGITVKVLRKKRKAELVASLIEQRRQDSVSAARSPPRKYQSPDEDPRQAGCTFLILDENTHRFPFEGMPSLQGKCISRLPSLPFALATLSETASTQSSKVDDGLVVDPDRVSYILDPESNLGATQERIQSFIESLTTRHKWSWRGVVGIEPTSKFVEESVTPVGGLLFFCGHGGGQSYFSRSRIDGLISSRASEVQRRCRSSIVLMGCSSGRLMSENRKHTKSSEQLPINFEPEGIALSYLCAGAPCVVGNLWDVTDRDIDRFSLSMLENFFGAEGNPSLPLCIAKARPSCRMKYLVGYAPVCYGVPVHLLPT